jgi:ferritin
MSAYFQSMGMAGCANWMKVQYQEELAHATHFFDYVLERGGRVELAPIGEVEVDFDNVLQVFQKTLAHEITVTGLINNLMDVAIHESDHATKSFLQWFVDEQVEEEANVEQILNNLKLINGEGQGLLMMDREMQARVFVNPFPAKA